MIEMKGMISLKWNQNEKWKDMLERMKTQPDIFKNDYSLGSIKWKDFKHSALSFKGINTFLYVQVFWNKYSYKPDKKDEWLTPYEFLQNDGGDCEDFAIAKYFSLLNLGMKEEDLGLLLVQDKEAHMVLLVHYEGKDYVLDNRRKGLSRFPSDEYKPVQMISENKTVSFLVPKGKYDSTYKGRRTKQSTQEA